MSPRSNRKPALGQRSTSKKHVTSMNCTLEPAICNESSRSVAEGIINMASQVQQDFPSTRLAISPLLPRSDNLELNDKIKEANKILNSFCSSRGLTLLHITNIDLTCLNRRGVHLNRKGSALLTNCYADFLRSS